MNRVENPIIEGLADGDVAAVARSRTIVDSKALSKQDILHLWEGVIGGMLKHDGNGKAWTRKQLINLGIKLGKIPHPLGVMYEDLLVLTVNADSPTAYAPTIKTGANVVRVKEGEIRERGFDAKRYLDMARGCLLLALKRGNANTKKYAATALRHFEYDGEVKEALLHVVKNGEPKNVKKAAEESLAHIRVNREGATVLGDKLLLMLNYPPHSFYFEYLFNAIGTVMESADVPAKTTEVEIALKQILTLYSKIGPAEGTFNREGLRIVKEDVENALLHAFSKGCREVRAEAAEGLKDIGGNRVKRILEKIADRNASGNELRHAAACVLRALDSKKSSEMLPPPFPFRRLEKAPKPKGRLSYLKQKSQN
jgi:hypothetical protein